MDDQIATAIQERVREGTLRCAAAFHIAKTLDVVPLKVGETADELKVRLSHCQLGLFGYGDRKSIVEPAENVSPELEQAIREGLVEGRLPCATVWKIATRLEISRLHVANATEKLEIRIGPCQIGAF
ncbi:MAG: hypothetical protein GY832_01655 [Chloroflexi bacterium]|nr:hypothetical protein [Chloroflexota bacterium]